MTSTSIYAIFSVLAVSLISFVGLFALSVNWKDVKKTVRFLVSFAVGALLGDVFIHLLPKLVEEGQFDFKISMIILISIFIFFIMESFIHWHHHHHETDEAEHKQHPVVFLNLLGDGLHNMIDGLIIGGAYLIDVQIGVATTIAVILHEIPQEIGDFGVLIYGGLTKGRALFYNFLSALAALLGVIIALVLGEAENFSAILVAIGIGSFIYISLADLIPEIHKSRGKAFLQLLAMLSGVAIMFALLPLE